MNIIAVDDEQLALELSEQAIKRALPDCTLSCFASSGEAVAYAKENQVDVAFLDIEMDSMNGIVLAKTLKEIYSKTNIVFVTGYTQYAFDSYTVKASEYLLKPLSEKMVVGAVESLREPVETKNDKRMRVQTFGNFEVFVDNEPLVFSYKMTTELLAYLVHRKGAFCSNSEIIAVLWEDKPDTSSLKSQFRNLVSDLIQTLKSKGLENIILKKHGRMAVMPDKFSCDFYDFPKYISYAVKSYAGEYMTQYSWAEFTNAYLSNSK